jgi:trans-aconitate methyltransferase
MNRGQSWDPARYKKNAQFVSDLGGPVVELLAAKPGEAILDLGCGDGVLTKKLADTGATVVGIDSSPQFIEASKALGLDARLMSGENLTFEKEFDAVFSNAALHWMKKPVEVIKGVHRALKPGGRFVAETGGQGNVNTIVEALYDGLKARKIDPEPVNPWFFPTQTEYRGLLDKNGFVVKQISLHARPTPLPDDIMGWLETFAGTFVSAIAEKSRPGFFEEVRETLKPKLFKPTEAQPKGQWVADYIRLRFKAVAV